VAVLYELVPVGLALGWLLVTVRRGGPGQVPPYKASLSPPAASPAATFRGGALVNGVLVGWPFAKLQLWSDQALLRGPFFIVTIARSEVLSVDSRSWPFGARGIRFRTDDDRLRRVTVRLNNDEAARLLNYFRMFDWSV
jgi:hypothetical protein